MFYLILFHEIVGIRTIHHTYISTKYVTFRLRILFLINLLHFIINDTFNVKYVLNVSPICGSVWHSLTNLLDKIDILHIFPYILWTSIKCVTCYSFYLVNQRKHSFHSTRFFKIRCSTFIMHFKELDDTKHNVFNNEWTLFLIKGTL